MTGAGSTGNSIKGNYLGPSSSLTFIAGSAQNYGIFFQAGVSNNIIGSTAVGEENQIAFNSAEGIRLFSLATTGNKISGNPIHSNTGKPVNLNYGANQANNGKAAPLITSVSATTVSGTSGAADVIEVFKNTTANCFDATNYVGTTTAIAGNWLLTGLSLVAGDYVLAVATDGSNNTSEFSACATINTITTLSVTPVLTRCTPITVTYSVTGTFNPGNIFKAELSDATGSFATPTSIGTVTAIVAAPITAVIPGTVVAGTLYRIRVIASDPSMAGTDNGSNLTIAADGGVGTWTWQGTASNDWFDRCNWDLKTLPNSSSFVTVPSGTPNNPYISGAHAACKTITIQSTTGARLNINSSGGWKLNITP